MELATLSPMTSWEALVLALGAMGTGIYLLIKGGDWTVNSSVYVAVHFGISPMVVLSLTTRLSLITQLANMEGVSILNILKILG